MGQKRTYIFLIKEDASFKVLVRNKSECVCKLVMVGIQCLSSQISIYLYLWVLTAHHRNMLRVGFYTKVDTAWREERGKGLEGLAKMSHGQLVLSNRVYEKIIKFFL